MKVISIVLTMAIATMCVSAHALSLSEARQMAHDNYPDIRQYELIAQSHDFTIDNIAKGWLPRVSVSAGAYGFTSILKSSPLLQQMGMDMSHLTMNGSITVSQNVYDGGQMAAQQQVTRAQSDVQARQLDVSMYAINEKVDQLFFGILLLDEQLHVNDLLLADLTSSERTINSMIKGGVANQGDLEAILVEKLKVSQQTDALQESRKSYIRMLGAFIGKNLPEDEKLVKPDMVSPIRKETETRPELSYYASQNLLLDAQRSVLDSKLHPTVSLFGTAMAHTRISNVLNDGFLMAGVTISWNIGVLYTRKNDLHQLELQRALNNTQRETFLFQNRIQNEESIGCIESLRKQITQDEEIVRLRESLRSKSDKKVQCGTESVNELVRDINAVSLARAQKALHEIELLKEIYKLKNLNNE